MSGLFDNIIFDQPFAKMITLDIKDKNLFPPRMGNKWYKKSFVKIMQFQKAWFLHGITSK